MIVSYDLSLEEQAAVEAMLTKRKTSIAKQQAKELLLGQPIRDIAEFITETCQDRSLLVELITDNAYHTRHNLTNLILNNAEKFHNEAISDLDFFEMIPTIFPIPFFE